jgi:hypothetical protein
MLTSSISRSRLVIICAIAAVLVLSWPPDRGHGSNLLIKLMHWAVDPANALPALPPPLPPGLGDNGDAVAEHDAIEAEYYRLHNSSAMTRWRMDVKAAGDPFDPTTERQVLIAFAVAGALAAWLLGRK